MRVKRFDILRRPGLEAASLARLLAPAGARAAGAPLPRSRPSPLPLHAGPARPGRRAAAPPRHRRPPPPPAPRRASLRAAAPPAASASRGCSPPSPPGPAAKSACFLWVAPASRHLFFKGVARKLSCFFFFFFFLLCNYIMSGIVFLFSPEESSQKK